MRFGVKLKSACLGLMGLTAGLAGCGVLATTINPNLLSSLGIDASSALPQQGVVLLTFNNQTQFPANAFFAVSDSTADPTSNVAAVPISNVTAGQQQTMVVRCPVGVVTPGAPSADFATDTAAVAVGDTAEGTTVNYTGAPLVFGRDFDCGDLIELQVLQNATTSGTGDNASIYSLRIIVHPG